MKKWNYNESVLNLSNSVLKYFGIKPFHNTLSYVDELLAKKDYKNVIIFVCDGLGSCNLEEYLKKDSFFRKNKIANLSSVFPPTTVASTTSILTGLTPSEHHWMGWDMYFKDTDETLSVYLNKNKKTNEKTLLSVSERPYMKYTTIVDLINNNTKYKGYYAYPFSLENKCNNLLEVIDRIKELSKQNERKFIYAYIENPDKLMHKNGIHSLKVKKEVININDSLEKLASELKDTIIFVTADHGLINSRYINIKEDFPILYNMLDRTTSIEARACGIKLKKNILRQTFLNFYNEILADSFDLLSSDEVLENELFGENKDKYIKDAIGDYLLIAKKDISLNYDENSPVFKANHAGITDSEKYVPLIVIES